MTSRTYRLALAEAQRELAHAMKQRDHWNLEIVRLQNLVKGLAGSALGVEQAEKITAQMQPEVSITEAVEAILNRSTGELTATEVRDALLEGGYGLGGYSNPLALVHQTLQRLAAAGRITELGGGRYGRWGGWGFQEIPKTR